MRSDREGVLVIATTASARSLKAGGASSPVSLCSIREAGPPHATATTGSPLAWASRITWPKVSVVLANMNASALAQQSLLGTAAGQHQMQPRVAPVGLQERIGQQLDSLLPAQPPRIQHVDL